MTAKWASLACQHTLNEPLNSKINKSKKWRKWWKVKPCFLLPKRSTNCASKLKHREQQNRTGVDNLRAPASDAVCVWWSLLTMLMGRLPPCKDGQFERSSLRHFVAGCGQHQARKRCETEAGQVRSSQCNKWWWLMREFMHRQLKIFQGCPGKSRMLKRALVMI